MRKIFILATMFMTFGAANLYAVCTVTRGKVEVSKGQGSTCSSIQDAVNLANGTDPLLVSVLPGIYTENISITQGKINLQGAGSDITIINPTSVGNAITLSNVDNVTISNFTIINDDYISTDAAIKNNNSSVIIRDNKIIVDWNGRGINNDSLADKKTIIEGNLIEGLWSDQEYGIYNNQSSSIYIKGNMIKGMGMIGIWNVSSSSVISENTIENAGWGIYCTGSAITISSNVIMGATGASQGIIDACSSVIINNRVTGNPTNDINSGTANVSFNIFDKGSVGIGKYNVNSAGIAW